MYGSCAGFSTAMSCGMALASWRGLQKTPRRRFRAAENRRATLQAELAQLDGSQQPAVVQFTPAMLERHLEGMTEKLRSGVNGKVREAIQQSIARILVGVDGSLTIEAKPGGLLGLDSSLAQLECREGRTLIEPSTHSARGRQWKLITARWDPRPAARKSPERGQPTFPLAGAAKTNLGPPMAVQRLRSAAGTSSVSAGPLRRADDRLIARHPNAQQGSG